TALSLEVGRGADGVGVVAVGAEGDSAGNRSELRIAGQFTEGGGVFAVVGGEGLGAITVTDGALLSIVSAGSDPRLIIGGSAGGSGTGLVSGTGSELILDNDGNNRPVNRLFSAIGTVGKGALGVLEAGQVLNVANGYTFVGLQPGSTGNLVVGGDSVPGSLFDAGAVLV